MGKTNIEWADETWPVTRGCEQVSPGCKNCYAKHMAARIIRMGKGKPTKYDGLVRLTTRGEPQWTGTARFCPEELATPLRMRSKRRIFVSSMSDLFHDDITNEQIAAVFGVMAACPQHTFMVLTKRARRMREWFEWVGDHGPQGARSACRVSASSYLGSPVESSIPPAGGFPWPLPNVQLGVSVENQAAADERIPELLRTPAAVRWISAEPLLGPLDLTHRAPNRALVGATARRIFRENGGRDEASIPAHLQPPPSLDGVIAGCESGPGARPAESAWYRSLRDQCAAAGAAFFLKQAREEGTWLGDNEHEQTVLCGTGSHRKPGGVIGAPYLDGVQHLELPGASDV